MGFHDDGKVTFDHIYNEADPRAYFSTMRQVDYTIPALARPHFRRLVDEVRAAEGRPALTVLDLGSSYGVNSVLLRTTTTLDDLYERYAGPGAAAPTRAELLARDRELVPDPSIRSIGLDVSAQALEYARQAGFVDDAIEADLEYDDPTPDQAARLGDMDVIISTGCIGYVTERTIARLVRAAHRPPVMAHFVLRMYPFDAIAATLAEFGYETSHSEELYRQRRFASAEEQEQVEATLRDVGVDPGGVEAEGWLYARLFLSRPRDRYPRRTMSV